MRNVGGVILAAAMLAGATGCTRVNYTRAGRYEQGLVVCLSGAGGMMGETERLREGLASGGVNRAIEVFEWSGGGVLEDQTDVEANRRKARQLARRVEGYVRSYPDRPVHLIGVSAGTGLVVWALEDLGDGCQATGAVLIASSLDTKYDLTRALAKVSDHLYSFNSVADTVLSLGVTWAGTVDRGGGIAGGLVGFSPPNGASDEAEALYKEKLVEISWWPGDVVLGHLGDHLGATSPPYVKTRIAPLVLGEEIPAPEAVKADAPMTAAYTKRLEQKRKAEEANNTTDSGSTQEAEKTGDTTKTHTPGKQTAPTSRKPKTSSADDDKKRFFDWRVGQKAAPTRAMRSTEEAQFFSQPRRLP